MAVGFEGGHGLVQASPAPIGGSGVCDVLGSEPTACSFLYPPDTTVQLNAAAFTYVVDPFNEAGR